MPAGLNPVHIVVVLVVALVVLGPDKLPGAARQAGKALTEVRRWSQSLQDEVSGALDQSDPTSSGGHPRPVAVGGEGSTDVERGTPASRRHR